MRTADQRTHDAPDGRNGSRRAPCGTSSEPTGRESASHHAIRDAHKGDRFARDEAIARFAALGVQLGGAELAPDAPALLARVLDSVSGAPSPLAAPEERARGQPSG